MIPFLPFSMRLQPALIAMISAGLLVSCEKPEKKKLPEKAMTVDIVMPPPEEVKQEMVEETAPVDEKPAEPDAPADDPGPIGLPEGAGPGNYGPGGKGGGGTGNGKGGGQNRSRFGWYAGQVQKVISSALQANSRTRNASFSVRVAIWADSTGRVTRAKLIGSSEDSSVDQAIQNEVLTGMQLSEAPPEGMPMPIQLRLTARKRN
jgi:periplasmic protein TonB